MSKRKRVVDRADDLARLLSQYDHITLTVEQMRRDGASIEQALLTLNMAALTLEDELAEGHQQRQEGLALERNHCTEE